MLELELLGLATKILDNRHLLRYLSPLLGHEICCDHTLQSLLPCRLSQEVAVCPGDLPSVPLPPQKLLPASGVGG